MSAGSPSPNLQAQIAYYGQRLIFQYAGRPKAQGVISILAYAAMMGDLIALLRDGFTLDTAVGPQLDILGKYIGLGRKIGPGTALDYFGLKDSIGVHPQNNYGLRDALALASNADVLMYDARGNVGQTTTLLDPQYRVALKLKILQNMTDGTLGGVQSGLMQFFGIPGFTCTTAAQGDDGTVTLAGDTVAGFDMSTPKGGGYTVGKGPYILFIGDGTGAIGQAAIDASGQISGPGTILSPGSGYTMIPTAYFVGSLISVSDQLDMNLFYYVSASIPVALSVLQTLLPRPMGVDITINIA